MTFEVERRALLAGGACLGVAALVPFAPAGAAVAAIGARVRYAIDAGWRFHAGDVPFPAVLGHEASYANAKAGNAAGAAAGDYDDGGWARVDLPHDFALDQPFDPAANLSQGFRRRGIAWYRRSFTLPETDRGAHLEVQFEGIATFATIWVNGNVVHRHFTGYTGFTIDLTPFALFGDDLNTIAVRVDADAQEGWWYEGAGLYRHVWLVRRAATHIATDGVHADPRRDPAGRWSVPVTVDLYNSGTGAAGILCEAILIDPDGRPVARAEAEVTVAALDRATARLAIPVDTPRPWSIEAPDLYTVQVRLRQEGRVIDGTDTRIGFRTIRFDADRGFFLNDRPTKIQGVCVHQDHAGVGVAMPDSLWDFRLRRIKAMGANAIRCAHNAPARELLDAADRLGVLVMNENRNFNVSEDYLPQLAWLVRRDRNHPSVILWSVCNEESIQGSPMGVEMVRRMAATVRALDPARPVTAAMNGGMFASVNISQAVDVVGFNYQADAYDRFHAENPLKPMLSSEDTSAYMTRGVYRSDAAAHVLASYDEEHAPWGATHRDGWKAIAERPYLAGGFVWTGFDYRGEPTPFDWPTVGSSFGAMDLCGFPKTAFFIHQALWNAATPMLHLAPHWTWPGAEGRPIRVMAVTNVDRVVLRLNGRIVADLPVDRYQMAECTIAYRPGRLEAVGYRAGRAVTQASVETTGPAVRLRLTPDRVRMAGDGRDAQPVTVEAIDAAGRALPTADLAVDFTVSGGRIIGLGNGDPNSHEPDRPGPDGARRRLFNGLAQVIVQSIEGEGILTLSAHAPGLRPAAARIAVDRVPAPAAIAAVDAVQTLTEWRQSPSTPERPDPAERIAEGDMNSWGWSKPGSTQPPQPGRYTRFRVAFVPRAAVRAGGGRLLFGRLAGRAEVWLDGRQVGAKRDPAPGRFVVPLPAGPGPHDMTLLFDAPSGSAPFGIAGVVRVEPIAP